MSEQLHGRALDEACARAMGFARHNGPIGWCKPDGRRERHGACPEFSRDAATLPEMVKWLERDANVFGMSWEADDLDDDRGLWEARCHPPHVFVRAHTLSEAVARLVCAVAAASGEAKP